jgi:sugar (pentulose or hexulose) kinase
MIIGVDLGTSIVQAVAFRKDGKDLALESSQVRIYNPRPEYHEQDIEETLEASYGTRRPTPRWISKEGGIWWAWRLCWATVI